MATRRPKAPPLTIDQIAEARRGVYSDAHLARIWGRPRQIVRLARRGLTFRNHPSLPDTRPRRRGGFPCRAAPVIA